MKKFPLQFLKRELEKINDLIEQRDKYISDNPSSDIQYENNTQELRCIYDQLDSVINNLEDWNNSHYYKEDIIEDLKDLCNLDE